MTGALPIATIELSRRLMQVNIAYVIARMRVIEARPGNPFGVEIRRIGDAAVLLARGVPSPYFNAVIGLRDEQVGLVGELDEYYRANNMRGRFVMTPGDFTPALGRALASRGYFQSEFDTVLYGLPPTSQGATSAGIEIEPVETAAAMERFLDVYLAGWEIPEDRREGSRTNMRGWLGVPDLRLYLARLDGRPAAAGKLFLHDRVGYFADAATPPESRGRGLQTALLRHRAAAAAQAGAELIYSHAAFGSISHRNMERLGLRVLHTRSVWTRDRDK